MTPTLINGHSYSWADLTVNLFGAPVAGISAISYESKRDKTNVYGAGSLPVARGYGNRTFDGSITLSTEEVEAIEKASPNGNIADIPPFTIVVAYLPENSNKKKVEKLLAVEFLGDKRAWKQNDQTGEVEIPLIIGNIVWNAA